MPQPLTKDQESTARAEVISAVNGLLLRAARAADVEVTEETPAGFSIPRAYADPAAGIRLAQLIEQAARAKVLEYIKRTRQAGAGWQQIGEVLHLTAPDGSAYLGDVAFDFAVDAEHSRPFDDLAFPWTCPECGGLIMDRGPAGGHPEDDEPGHADTCPRLAAAVADYSAHWADV